MAKSKSRRARGTGTIFYSEARGCWVARRPVGRSPAGRTLYLERSGRTQRKALDALAAAAPPDRTTCTVRDWGERWLSTLRVRPGTRRAYVASLSHHVYPALGGFRLSAVRPSHLDALAAALLTRLAPATVRRTLAPLRAMLAAAHRDDLVAKNPARGLKSPRPAAGNIDPLPAADLRRLIDHAPGRGYAGRVVAILAATGMRVGEACGLDAADWDAAAGTLAVRRTFDPTHGEGPPKSRRGTRTLAVPAAARPLVAGAAGGRKAGPLFAAPGGGRTQPGAVGYSFRRALADLGLAPRNTHQLRHSVVSALVAAGVPVADVARYVGDSVQVVVSTYLHPTAADPATTMDRLLAGGK